MSETRHPMHWMGQKLDNWSELRDENDMVIEYTKHDSPGCDVSYDPQTGKPKD